MLHSDSHAWDRRNRVVRGRLCSMARRTKFTEQAQRECLKHLRLGMPRRAAAAMAGWSSRTLETYLQQGRAARADGQSDDPKAMFVADVEKAEAQCKRAALAVIFKAANGSPAVLDGNGNVITDEQVPQWQAAAWLLERRFPQEFGVRRIVTGGDGGPINVAAEVSAPSVESLQESMERVRRDAKVARLAPVTRLRRKDHPPKGA